MAERLAVVARAVCTIWRPLWSAGDALMLAGLARLLWYTMKGEFSDRTL